MNYKEDVKIDETALDIEWLEQPQLMMKYVKHAAKCDQLESEAKEALEFCMAKIDNDVRTSPSQYGLEKVTDTAIKSIVLQNKEYIDLNKSYIDAKFEAKVANGAIKAFEQRKSALENLVKLHGQSYFAGPSVPRDIKFERQEYDRQQQARIAEKISKKKK